MNHSRVNFQDDENMNPIPIRAVVTLRNASERFVVAALLIIWVSSESLLRSSPVRVTSKNAISCRILIHGPVSIICYIKLFNLFFGIYTETEGLLAGSDDQTNSSLNEQQPFH